MAVRHVLQRFSPRLDRRWLIGLLVVAGLAVAASFLQLGGAAPPIDLVALGPDGRFQDTLRVPASWGDTATSTPEAIVRIPLILGVRNLGNEPVRPERLSVSLPLRYRLTTGSGEELESQRDPGSPLIRYSLDTELGPLEPARLPVMLPAHDTLWLEAIVPSYYCVSVADSIPEFVPATTPPVETLSSVQMFYSFDGGELRGRRTGTLTVFIDTTLLRVETPEQPPAFAMTNDPDAALPELGALERVGSRRALCGEPESPMELLSTVWETASGGRFISLDYGGRERKRLFDLDGDGVIERESWDPTGRGEFTATRQARLPTPLFLLPRTRVARYDMARFDTIPGDSLARLDPFRHAMPGPGPMPAGGDSGLAAPGRGTAEEEEARPAPAGDPGLLGRPVRLPPPDTGGG